MNHYSIITDISINLVPFVDSSQFIPLPFITYNTLSYIFIENFINHIRILL